MAKRRTEIPEAVHMLPKGVDYICNETAAQIDELGRQHTARAQEIADKLHELAHAVREHGRMAAEYVGKYSSDTKHTMETLERLRALHNGETTLEEIVAIEHTRLPPAPGLDMGQGEDDFQNDQ